VLALVATAAAAAAFVLVWFEPQKLLIDERVDDPVPTVAATDGARPPADGAAAAPRPAEPVEVAGGSFASRDHGTSGVVRVLALPDGRRVVRLEGLETDNGPDLYLYLSPNAADGDEGAFDDAPHDLGRLQGNLGDQNYELPATVDLTGYRSVVIWCDRFDSAFGAAELAPV
jgi:hypothetical protein